MFYDRKEQGQKMELSAKCVKAAEEEMELIERTESKRKTVCNWERIMKIT